MNPQQNNTQESFFNTIIVGGFLNIIIGAMALTIDTLFNIPQLPINKSVSFFIFIALIVFYAFILIWAAFSISKAKKENKLAKTGLYGIIRHPIYVGIVLLVNPALAILFRSWSLLEACLILYFLWKHLAKNEEKKLIEIFGDEYKDYCKKTSCLFPKIC